MDSEKPTQSRNDLWTFLVFLLGGSLLMYGLIIRAGGLASSGILPLGLMWVPGLSAILTVLVHKRGMRSLGWRPGKFKYLAIAYIMPVFYGLVVYGAVWVSGLGGVNFQPVGGAVGIAVLAVAGVLMSLVSALGEEIGWRGYFIVRLAEIMPYRRAVLLSGAVWVLWHMPLILFSDYNSGATPIWYSLVCFTILVMGLTFVFSWLRMRSGSLWPAALLHATHNLFIQNVFDAVTVDTGRTTFFTGEFGAGLALVGILMAGVMIWIERREKPRALQEPGVIPSAP